MRCALAIPLILLLAGCGSRDNDPGPGGVSVGEARALDDAAQMLDARKPAPLPDPHPELGTAATGDAGAP